MPRLPSKDYLQNFRFRVMEGDGNIGALGPGPVAGFSSVTVPEITVEMTEYRIGNEVWSKKLRGIATIEACTMIRGIMLGDSIFYAWVMDRVFGRQPYRTKLVVNQYNQVVDGTKDEDVPSRQITMENAFPTRVKLMGDMDATASDVSLQEVEVAIERLGLVALPAASLGMDVTEDL
jgi:phage tail-like protein